MVPTPRGGRRVRARVLLRLILNAATKLEIPAKVPYDFLISLMKDVGRDWDIDYELQVGLTVDLPIIGNFTIPLSTSGEFKLPTLKDMF